MIILSDERRNRPYTELSPLWMCWFVVWLKHFDNPIRRAICYRHMQELEARGA